ncbi:MAG: CopG family transcriptional regulator [Chloroflexota bacterium]
MAETEKITINLSVVDLGKIDLLVEEGFYTNRTDCIRSAIRRELYTQKEHIDATITRQHRYLGVIRLNAADLEKYHERGEMLELSVVGFLKLDDDISADLAEATIKSVKVTGVFSHSKEVMMRLNDLGRLHNK